jgi:hypothetical protein
MLKRSPALARRYARFVDCVAPPHSHPVRRGMLLSAIEALQPVFLDYRVEPHPRFGHHLPAHRRLYEIIDAGRDRYADTLRGCLKVLDELLEIPNGWEDVTDPSDPTWVNDFFGGLDGAVLYSLVRLGEPALYLEIGSGTSTKYARRAIRNGGLRTKITSIDPEPRAEVDQLCDTVIRRRMEDADLALFDALRAGDVLFVDGSHRVFMNSDVTVLFLEVIPRLEPGVLVHLHDILLPEDYPPEWADRFYAEQYLLAAWLLGGGEGLEIVLPSAFVTADPELSNILGPLWDHPRMSWATTHGSSFWLRTR